MLDLAVALAIGLALGAATGIPLGVVNAAVVEAAIRAGRRPATALGLGGALADGTHAALAFAGIAPLLTSHADIRRVMVAISAAAIVLYAALVWRRRDAAAPPPSRPTPATNVRAVLLGLSLTLPNPAALTAWVAVSGSVPHERLSLALTAALGVALGSAAWFALLAHLASRGSLSSRASRWLPRAIALLLLALAAFAIARELR